MHINICFSLFRKCWYSDTYLSDKLNVSWSLNIMLSCLKRTSFKCFWLFNIWRCYRIKKKTTNQPKSQTKLQHPPCKHFAGQFFKLMQFNYYINLMAIFPYFNHVKCAGNNELLMLSLSSLRGIFRALLISWIIKLHNLVFKQLI